MQRVVLVALLGACAAEPEAPVVHTAHFAGDTTAITPDGSVVGTSMMALRVIVDEGEGTFAVKENFISIHGFPTYLVQTLHVDGAVLSGSWTTVDGSTRLDGEHEGAIWPWTAWTITATYETGDYVGASIVTDTTLDAGEILQSRALLDVQGAEELLYEQELSAVDEATWEELVDQLDGQG